MPPFIVFALPRSRTAWLSRFLTYGDWFCSHDELRHCRQLEDVKSWLSQPNTGTVETTGASFWRLALHMRPDLRIVTIRRDPEEVIRSARKAGYDPDPKLIHHLDSKLGQIERRVPGCLSINYADLANEETCARLFEHLLPYKHNSERWEALNAENVQTDPQATIRYVNAYATQLDRVRAIARQKSLSLLASRRVPRGQLVIEPESFAKFWQDGQALFREHEADVGQHPNLADEINAPEMFRMEGEGRLSVVTARCNGRVFGYLMSIITPSFESADIKSAYHTAFFASPLFPGLGMKLQRAALENLRHLGTKEVVFRAGTKGDGPRLGALYRRLGAEGFGELYRLEL